jgi:O-acetylhomoserine/O-acetylserine sulfhydrylase-like pyridoxal-dependent enzyme
MICSNGKKYEGGNFANSDNRRINKGVKMNEEFADKTTEKEAEAIAITDKAKLDQIATVMMQHGTPEQQEEALVCCGVNTAAVRVESNTASAYRLKRTIEDGELVLQGCYQWQQGADGGFTWRDIETIEE